MQDGLDCTFEHRLQFSIPIGFCFLPETCDCLEAFAVLPLLNTITHQLFGNCQIGVV